MYTTPPMCAGLLPIPCTTGMPTDAVRRRCRATDRPPTPAVRRARAKHTNRHVADTTMRASKAC
eukprot:525055-Prymnesium_polylepis.1